MRKLFLSLAGLALIASPVVAGKYNKVISVGDKAPTFSGIPAIMDGKDTTISLDSIKEDVVVVVFLANHCPAVVANEDRLIDLAKSFKGKSVKVVGICATSEDVPYASQDNIEGIREHSKTKGYNYVYGYEPSGKVGKAYGASVTPQFYVLDKDRTVRYTGALDDSVQNESKVTKTYVKDAVKALLSNESIEVTETRATGCGIPYKK